MLFSVTDLLSRVMSRGPCLLCGWPASRYLCGGCMKDMPWNDAACARCAMPMNDTSTQICPSCAQNPPPQDATVTVFRYEFPVDALVQQFKFRQALYLAPWFAEMLLDVIRQRGGTLPDHVLPVPLHRRRLLERGYNQSMEIARYLAGRTGLQLLGGVRRDRDTPPQSGLDANQRRRNLAAAFSTRAQQLPARVAIVDDVITTGSTCSALAKLLRRHGVTEIQVWAVARAE